MKTLNPKKLKQGDLISIVSPSAGLAELFPHRIKKAEENLLKLGFKVRYEKNSLKRNGWVSGTIAERVSDLHNAFKDKNVKAIICSIGGNHSNELLKHINWKIIKANPKIFLGYSDITVLHNAILKKTGLRTFYGPCIISEFGEYPDIIDYTKNKFTRTLVDGDIGKIESSNEWTQEFLDWFDPENHTRTRKLEKNLGHVWWRKGKNSGNLAGGCIPSLNHLAGTEFWNNFKSKILFLDLPEGTTPGEGLSVSDFDSYMADLYNLKVFDQINGLIIGRPYFQDEKNILLIKEIVLKYTANKKYPILFNVDIGHTSPMLIIPYAGRVILDSGRNLFEIKNNFIN